MHSYNDQHEKTKSAGPSKTQGASHRDVRSMQGGIRDDQVSDGEEGQQVQEQVPRQVVLEGVAERNPPDIARQETQSLRVDGGRVRSNSPSPGRCVWDLLGAVGSRWKTPACGGPRSCDGSCARFAVHAMQYRSGMLQGRQVVTSFGHQVSGPPIGYLPPCPVWHSSAASSSRRIGQTELHRIALRYLAGVGDKDGGEWHEWTGYAIHVRRRLTVEEQASIGDALDCRGTEEGQRRFDAVKAILPVAALKIAEEELNHVRS